MEINGHEIKFMRTVLANCEIAKECENRDISNFDKLLQGDTATSYHAQCLFICALQKGWEMHEKFENKDYQPAYLTEEELMLLDPEAFNELVEEAFKVFAGDAYQEIETQEPKEAKKNVVKDSKKSS